jgi:hypothetical protein
MPVRVGVNESKRSAYAQNALPGFALRTYLDPESLRCWYVMKEAPEVDDRYVLFPEGSFRSAG